MRTEAGKMPESLTFPIKNGLGVSNDRFGFKQLLDREQGQVAGSAEAENRAQRVHEHLEILCAVNKGT